MYKLKHQSASQGISRLRAAPMLGFDDRPNGRPLRQDKNLDGHSHAHFFKSALMEMSLSPYKIRHAVMEDCPALQDLIDRSARAMSPVDYTAQQIEMALAGTFGVDTQLIADRTLFVAELEGVIVGSGGWSRRPTLFGGDKIRRKKIGEDAFLDPKFRAAKIRAFFIDPLHVRKGIGRALLSRCEEEASAAGFTRFELAATLPGVRLYEACGYVSGERFQHDMDGVSIDFVPMFKRRP